MQVFVGILIIAIGSFIQSGSYLPIKKIQNWSWESFWLAQGIFAWLIFPLISLLIISPNYTILFDILSQPNLIYKPLIYGFLWGIGSLTFGLSMRYLGVALGQSIALGACSAFGTLIPAILSGNSLFTGKGLILLIGVSITVAGISIISYAGSLRAKNLTIEQKKIAVKEYSLSKGILVALLAGVMSACFSLGIESGAVVKSILSSSGFKESVSGMFVILLITVGGFFSNAIYCIFQIVKNNNFENFYKQTSKIMINNILFSALAGGAWFSQFLFFESGKSHFESGSVVLLFSWSILLSLNVVFSNVWGLFFNEWKGANSKIFFILLVGIIVLITSFLFVVK
jgi:L-rhamnose-H+ transport protein